MNSLRRRLGCISCLGFAEGSAFVPLPPSQGLGRALRVQSDLEKVAVDLTSSAAPREPVRFRSKFDEPRLRDGESAFQQGFGCLLTTEGKVRLAVG